MDENNITNQEPVSEIKSAGKYDRFTGSENKTTVLSGQYKNWWIDYASYVILERAVPHLEDGLKPVQRRILHSMRRLDDGRYNKVANIVGHTMQFHPHGDASIGDALVQLGQKDLLVDCQGNWGNILTGDDAAAPRYIEARLSKFALEVVFNPKTTEWMLSYDGRNEEPVTLPVKFPLLLAQGAEGIAVGLASKILPHNFNELIDGCIAHLRGEEFTLYPDFPTGGMIDVSRYNDGVRGGVVKVRAKISKIDKKTLAITEIPFGTTTESIKDSIIKANDKGKIKIKKVDDNTAGSVEIIIHVSNDESSDKTIDALYAFTDCEVSISPNACVVFDDKPHFLGVSQILRHSAEHTKGLLMKELEIRLGELTEAWHMANLERIFIENRIYQVMESCKTHEAAYSAIDERLAPFKKQLRREVSKEDIVKLTNLKFIRITRYDATEADNQIRDIEKETEQVQYNIAHITDYAIAYYTHIKEKYGAGRERRTEIRSFDSIEAVNVAVNNSKLYVDRAEGFFGIGKTMKDSEFVCDCSDIDDIIVICKDGRYIITKVADKAFFQKSIYYIGVFKRGDERTIYNVLYRDGKNGPIMMKRCAITSITRDKEYDMTRGEKGSELVYMSVNHNGEAEVLKIYFRPRPRLKKVITELDFSSLAIKGRQSRGNLFSRYGISKIVLKEKGTSTLGGEDIWYDDEIRRLNNDGHGKLLGEFKGNDRLLVVTRSKYYVTGYDLGNHFPEDTVRVQKFHRGCVISVVYFDSEQNYYYLKRFAVEDSDRMQQYIDDGSRLVCLTTSDRSIMEIVFGGAYVGRTPESYPTEEFIAVKGIKAKGKRVTTYEVGSIKFLEQVTETPDDTSDGSLSDDESDEASDYDTPDDENSDENDDIQGDNGADEDESGTDEDEPADEDEVEEPTDDDSEPTDDTDIPDADSEPADDTEPIDEPTDTDIEPADDTEPTEEPLAEQTSIIIPSEPSDNDEQTEEGEETEKTEEGDTEIAVTDDDDIEFEVEIGEDKASRNPESEQLNLF